ncbi:hypothetical protein FQR65_LT17361 [Abscondita terminalis]|nr:hypothetical protein FQR65_LT17361 [Abscondita terminalis]
MLSDVRPFMTFMDVENSRSYIDDLYSSEPDKCLTSLICIKNSVIGSNRQKESVIAQGIVPRLIQLLKDKNRKSAIRLESIVTIGSLAKAGAAQVLTNLLGICSTAVRIPTLTCLAAMCFENRAVAGEIVNTTFKDSKITNVLGRLLCRDKPIEHAIPHRAAAANTLAYLTEVDSELQQTTAISNQLVGALADLLNSSNIAAKQAAFSLYITLTCSIQSNLNVSRAFASLGANDEDIRKRIIETNRLMDELSMA